MKKLLQMGALFCGLLLAQSAFALSGPNAQNYQNNQNFNASEVPTVFGGECPADHPHPNQPCDQAMGDCYCLMVHYEPCYYTTQRCVEEQVPCKKKCVRYVDKFYEVQRCKYVPQYYCETYCQKCPECYEVDDFKCCKKMVCDQHCKWVPKYYWKHNQCAPQCAPQQCAPQQCCPQGY